MAISTACDHCGRVYRVSDELIGRLVRCKSCGDTFQIRAQPPGGKAPSAVPVVEPEEPVHSESHVVSGPTEPSFVRHKFTQSLTLEQHLERATGAFEQSDFETAARHLQGAAGQTSALSIRDQLQDALKLQFSWMLLLRTMGLVAPISKEQGVSRSRYVFFAVISIATSALIKLARTGAAMEDVAILALSALFGLVMIAKVLDCTATLLVRGKPGGRLAVTGADVFAAWLGIALLLNAGAWLFFTASTKNAAWAAICMMSFANVRAVQLTCRTPAGAARIATAAYLAVLDLAASVGIVMLCRQVVPGNLSQRIPTFPGLLILISYILVAITTLIRSLATIVFGSGLSSIDDRSQASRPGGIPLSDERLRRFHPELYGIRGFFFSLLNKESGVSAKDARSTFRHALSGGDVQPAVVVSVEPLIVAAYSDDLDAVVLLEFEGRLVGEFGLARGQRLVSVNTYFPMQYRHLGPDIEMGPDSTNAWGNVTNYIADFLTEDTEALRQAKQGIRSEEWDKLNERLSARLTKNIRPRDGSPLYCHIARSVLESEA